MEGLSGPQLIWQPAPGRWSIAGYLDHLHLTVLQYTPRFETALSQPLRATGPFIHGGAIKNWINRNIDNPDRLKIKTAPEYIPIPSKAPSAILHDYWQSHATLAHWIQRADGLDLARIRCPHPHPVLAFFLRWSLGQAIQQLLGHERRYLAQAGRIRNHPAFPQD